MVTTERNKINHFFFTTNGLRLLLYCLSRLDLISYPRTAFFTRTTCFGFVPVVSVQPWALTVSCTEFVSFDNTLFRDCFGGCRYHPCVDLDHILLVDSCFRRSFTCCTHSNVFSNLFFLGALICVCTNSRLFSRLVPIWSSCVQACARALCADVLSPLFRHAIVIKEDDYIYINMTRKKRKS